MTPSHYQKAVYEFTESGSGHGLVDAVAGSGKSTTGLEAVKRFPSVHNGLIAAFSKKIQEAFQSKVVGVDNVTVSTYNGFGWKLLLNTLDIKPKLDMDKTDNILKYNILDGSSTNTYYKTRNIIKRLISLFKNMAFMDVEEAKKNLDFVVERFDFTLPEVENFEEILFATYQQSIDMTSIMDFDDQKFMPIRLQLAIPQYDFLIIDEYQDTCIIETMLIEGACRDGRMMVFGDPDQCIYSFKGTTPDAMKLFTEKYAAKHLPLSICYRCPVEVINEAKKVVPRIEAAPGAIQGCVDTIKHSEFVKRAKTGDMILCRCTAPLVSSCLGFITQGKEAYVEGKEIGQGLINLIDSINPKGNDDIYRFHQLLEDYKLKKLEHFTNLGKENEALNLSDKVDTILAVLTQTKSVSGLKAKITSIFKDKFSGIGHMTIHKSKGLESGKDNDVYLLQPELLPHPRSKKKWMKDEEMRLLYVARTRAKRGLYYVPKEA